MPSRTAIPAAVLMLAAGAATHAGDLFSFTVTETGNPANTLTAGDSSLPDLAEALADTTGAFSAFATTDFTASLTYGGVAGALDITYQQTGGAFGGERLIINNILGSNGPIVFDSANGSLGDQLEDFFLEDDPERISKFLEEIAKRSVVAITDGNPSASTNKSANYKFHRFGLHADFAPSTWRLSWMNENRRPVVPAENGQRRRDGEPDLRRGSADAYTLSHQPGDYGSVSINQEKRFRTRVDFTGGVINAGDFEGSSFDLAWSGQFRLDERFAFVLGIPISYHEIEGADVFQVGVHLDAPITIVSPGMEDRSGFTWQFTPGIGSDTVGSFDFAAGGVLTTVSFNNRLAYDLQQWSFVAAQQISFHEGQEAEFDDDRRLDPGVSQQILKLGGKVTYMPSDNIFLYGGATWTTFGQDAAVDQFTSPMAGFGFRSSGGSVFTLGWRADFGDDYDAQLATFTVDIPF